jgi:hypothetical protein
LKNALRPARASVIAFQNARLLHDGRKVGDRLFVDDRRLGLWRLPDFWQVAAGQ